MRPFIGYGQTQYIGQPAANPIKLRGIATISVPLLFQWISYGASTARPNINVLVDCRTQACARLDNIRSLYIDNLGSDVPIYVYFPDTGYAIVAKPNSCGWYPAYTNERVFWVIGLGFLDGNIPQTSILACNAAIEPSINVEIDSSLALYLASPTITRGSTIYNTNFGTPALGDQTLQVSLDTVFPSPDNIQIFPVLSEGFYIITNLLLQVWAAVTPDPATELPIVIESTGIAGILYQFFPYIVGGVANSFDIASLQPTQIKIDATQTWRLRHGQSLSSGLITLIVNFTETNL